MIHPGAAFVPEAAELGTSAASADPIILTVARLGELYKGHDMLIRALPLIAARHPSVRYVIVGDGPLRPYLQRLAASVGVDGRVTFAGEVSDAELHEWYRRATVLSVAKRPDAVMLQMGLSWNFPLPSK